MKDDTNWALPTKLSNAAGNITFYSLLFTSIVETPNYSNRKLALWAKVGFAHRRDDFSVWLIDDNMRTSHPISKHSNTRRAFFEYIS